MGDRIGVRKHFLQAKAFEVKKRKGLQWAICECLRDAQSVSNVVGDWARETTRQGVDLCLGCWWFELYDLLVAILVFQLETTEPSKRVSEHSRHGPAKAGHYIYTVNT